MGLFSSIKKGLSKAWSGTKKAIKGVARSVKKVAKKVAYAVPGGKALWDLSSKIGGEVMKGIGKISAKLGPVGMMALSFVLAPVMGPMVTSLWGSVSSVAGGIASQAATFVSSLGSAGTALVNGVTSAAKGIYAAGNFVGGTIDAMSKAITEGASNVMNGQFSKAASSFATNMSDAFTGKAGMASVNRAAAQSALASGELLGDPSQVMGANPGGSFEPVDFGLDSAGMSLDPSLTTNIGNVGNNLGNSLSPTGPQFTPLDTPLQTMAQQGQEALYGKAGNLSLTEQDAFMKYGAEGVKGIQPGAEKVKSNLLDKAKKAKDLYDGLGGTGAASGYQPYVPKAIQSQTISNPSNARGQGSAGFSLLGGVQGLEQSIRNSQKIMFG
jgi:hypothetical protein